ncbi:unnamed protein product [Ectocarpus sp. 12 AP-2014]
MISNYLNLTPPAAENQAQRSRGMHNLTAKMLVALLSERQQMDQPRPPPPPYSPSMADSPTPPYRAPLRDRPTTVQQAVTDPGTNPPLPEAPGDVQGAVRRLGPKGQTQSR